VSRAKPSFASEINFDVILQEIEFKQGPLTAQVRVVYQISDICVGQSDCETGFFFSEYFLLSLANTVFTYILLFPQSQTGKVYKPSKKQSLS
jgi:hypothetical protein